MPAGAPGIARIAERVECDAYVNMIGLAPSGMRVEQAATIKRLGACTFFSLPRVDWMTPNRIMGLGVYEPATEGVLEEVVELCRRLRPARFYATVCEFADPGHLTVERWLTARGFTHHNDWIKLYRDATSTPGDDDDEGHEGGRATALKVKKVGKEHAEDFAKTAVAAFGYPEAFTPWLELPLGEPGWHHFMAFDEERPVATGALFVEGEVGNLLLGSTLPSHRGRGAQGTLMTERVRFGAENGCKVFVTETHTETPQRPNPSYHNMLRLGFKLAYLRRNYVLVH